MAMASLNARLRKIQSAGEGENLDWWAARYHQEGGEVPDYVLVSLVVGRMLPKHLADAVFDSKLCREWRDSVESRIIHFPTWLEGQGTSVDDVVNDVSRGRCAR